MKKNWIFILLLFIGLNIYSQDSTFVIKNKYSKGIGVVFTEHYTPPIKLPPNSKVFTPNLTELNQAESLLMSKYNDDLKYTGWETEKNIRKKYWKYNRQYLAFINEEGEKLILLNLLNFKCKRKANKMFEGWTDSFFVGFGEYYEKNTIRFIVNIDTQKLGLF